MKYLAAGYLSVAALTNIPVLYLLWVDWRHRRTTQALGNPGGFSLKGPTGNCRAFFISALSAAT